MEPRTLQSGVWEWLDPKMNWWNVMETTFGFIMGGVLTLGIALNRKLISPQKFITPTDVPEHKSNAFGTWPAIG